ncbi:FAD dependent oxidoreductase [Auriculariales sp. MPI-PUGE-AT-0066]|nr:FAD dependent oxidoreductase [Auriculariales sp. MPI-PUGE-AT-0066]
MVRGIRAALNATGRFPFRQPDYAVDHLVIGGGIVGLAIGARLSKRPDTSTVVVERHSIVGQETSSRNSEVIHAGIYYPADSHKTKLCVRGRVLLKNYCELRSVPCAWPGKLVVAGPGMSDYVAKLHAHSQSLQVFGPDYPFPRTELLSGQQAREMQPDLSNSITAALLSHDTGIIDSHTFMQALETDIGESEGGDLALGTQVVRVDPVRGSGSEKQGWVVQVVTGDSEQGDAILARNLINASGLSANLILNSLVKNKEERIPMFFARGSYATYRGPGVSQITKLIYPTPALGAKSFHGLGTHLTLDMGGNVRFGPDVEWIEPPAEVDEEDASTIGFWEKYHRPEENPEKLKAMHEAVTSFLPDVVLGNLSIDYAGIRSKTGGPTAPFQDFQFRIDRADRSERGAPMLTLLGIESPGLTSALAIAEHVESMLYP